VTERRLRWVKIIGSLNSEQLLEDDREEDMQCPLCHDREGAAILLDCYNGVPRNRL
jgi:hypothetical protein